MPAKKILPFYIFSLLFNICLLTTTKAQTKILQNTVVLNLLKQGTQKMYNYDFDGAAILFNQANVLLPKHPAPFLLKGMLLHWQNLPMSLTNPKLAEMEKLLLKSIELGQAMQEIEEEDPEGIFFELTARSLIMQYYAKSSQNMKALGEARNIYSHVKTGMKLKDKFNEFYFTSGIYNYYREAYPEAKPFYKSLVWIFQSGNKKLGLEQLVYAGNHTIIAQTQAWAFLTHIYLTYEKNPARAVEYAKELVTRFPKNRYFMSRYIETLLLTKQYNLAEPLIQNLLKETSPEPFTVMITQVLAGILAEKQAKNYILAKNYYHNAIKLSIPFGIFGNHYQAYSYLGLSRIATLENQAVLAKTYRKKAEEIAEYKYIFAFE
jgi:tetratricopeptide (TPR) repeat protein